MRSTWALLVGCLLAISSCGGSEASSDADPMCADVVAADVAKSPDGSFRFDVTVRSDETGWDAYADR